MRDSRICGPVCTEPYAACINDTHCAHGVECTVHGCLCSCHRNNEAPEGPKPYPAYYMEADNLWKCCKLFIRDHVASYRMANMDAPKPGHTTICRQCKGQITLKGETWRWVK